MTIEQELAVREFVGEEKGFKKGHKEGREEGREEGIQLGKIATLNELVVDGTLSLEAAARKANCSIEEFQELVSKLEIEQ